MKSPADERAVGARTAAMIPRVIAIAAAVLFVTATITYAAGTALRPRSVQSKHPARAARLLVVPDVRRQVFVFAKGMLEDEGFGWRVEGSVHGYPSNIVVSQSPAPRTRVVNTGAPGVTLELARNSRYAQAGNPEDRSPYGASIIRTVERSSSKHRAKPARVKRVTKAHRKSQ